MNSRIDFRKFIKDELASFILTILSYAFFFIKVAQDEKSFEPNSWKQVNLVLVALASIMLLVYLLVIFSKYKRTRLKEGSKEFDDFFEKWYNRDGVVYLCCGDLDWLKPKSRLFDILEKKAKNDKLNVYLETFNGNSYTEISKFCKNIYERKNSGFPNIFSIIIDHDHTGMIVRYKKGLGYIFIEEYHQNKNDQEKTVIEIGRALLDSWKQK